MTLHEYRCQKCGRLLFKSDAPAGWVQVFCRQCKAVRGVEVGPRDGARLVAVQRAG